MSRYYIKITKTKPIEGITTKEKELWSLKEVGVNKVIVFKDIRGHVLKDDDIR